MQIHELSKMTNSQITDILALMEFIFDYACKELSDVDPHLPPGPKRVAAIT